MKILMTLYGDETTWETGRRSTTPRARRAC
jgi:hypothetical protein